MNQYLTLTIQAHNQPTVLPRVAEFISSCQCFILSSRMFMPYESVAGIYLVSGNWHALAKLENTMANFAAQNQVDYYLQRIASEASDPAKWLPYTVELLTHDIANVTEAMLNFFVDAGAKLEEAQNNYYIAGSAQIPMHSFSLRILVPADTQLSDLRERFAALCDFLNVDAYLEPERS